MSCRPFARHHEAVGFAGAPEWPEATEESGNESSSRQEGVSGHVWQPTYAGTEGCRDSSWCDTEGVRVQAHHHQQQGRQSLQTQLRRPQHVTANMRYLNSDKSSGKWAAIKRERALLSRQEREREACRTHLVVSHRNPGAQHLVFHGTRVLDVIQRVPVSLRE